MNAQAPIARAARACGLLLTAALAVPGARRGGAHRQRPTCRATRPASRSGSAARATRPRATSASSFRSPARTEATSSPAKDPLKADAAGGIHGRLPAPAAGVGQRPARDRDPDRQRPGADRTDRPIGPPEDSFAATQFLLSAVDVLVVPWLIGHVNPRALTTFRVIGWEPYRRVYAHYFLNGKRLKTVEIGSVSGPCGDMTKKVRQFPFRPVPAGRYRIRFTGTTFYDPQGFWIGYRDVVVAEGQGRALAPLLQSEVSLMPALRGAPRARSLLPPAVLALAGAAGRHRPGLARAQRLHGLRLEPHRLAVQRRHLRLAAGRREPDPPHLPPRRRRPAGVVARRRGAWPSRPRSSAATNSRSSTPTARARRC